MTSYHGRGKSPKVPPIDKVLQGTNADSERIVMKHREIEERLREGENDIIIFSFKHCN